MFRLLHFPSMQLKRIIRPIVVTLLLSLFLTTFYFSNVIQNEVDVGAHEKGTFVKKLEQISHGQRYSRTENIQDVKCDPRISVEEKAVVFIKIMKCASTSISSLLMHFAYERDLEFVHPVSNRIYIGWPYFPKSHYILRPVDGSRFHISSHHVVYDRSFFNSIMMPNAKYIASLRQPYSQFKSMVNYFNVLNISGVPHLGNSHDRFEHFVYNLEFYDVVYKSPNKTNRYCIPDGFSMTKNLMSFSLGFPHLGGFKSSTQASSNDRPVLTSHETLHEKGTIVEKYAVQEKMERSLYGDQVKNWLNKLDEEMDLILIVEWLSESLILMRRKFCWSMKDILIRNSNALSYQFRFMGKDSYVESIYRSWSWIDYELYDHFNKSLWRKLDAQPTSFWMEVQRFNEILLQITEFCSTSNHRHLKLKVDASEWNKEFQVQFTVCSSMDKYIKMLKSRYSQKLKNRNIAGSSEVKLNETFC